MNPQLKTLIDQGKTILLFDGVCNLCNGLVQFILARDPKKHIYFASLQSESGQALLLHFDMNPDELNTLVLIDQKGAHLRSTAALRCARLLAGGWPLFYAFIIIPRAIRDTIYNWVASNRYRWFGKQDQCMIPTPELKARFL